MGDDITIGVTEIVNNIEVTAQPNDQIVEIDVVDNSDDVTLNITPTVIEININKGSSFARWGDILGNLPDQEDLQNVLNLKADLVGGLVPASQLPSYVDDIIEVANYAALPTTGEVGKIYVTLDNNKIFRWSGSVYIEIAANTGVWGAITGTLSSQTDLQTALDTKALKTITITPSAPLSGGGDLSANRTISISQSNATTDGYLSSIDWNAFNDKQYALNGTGFVKISGTTISYDNSTYVPTSRTLTINGTSYDLSTNRSWTIPTHDAVTIGTPANGLSLSGQVLSLSVAHSLNTGALSSTDWTTFNNKIGGSGTTNYVPKFTASGTIGNSLIYDNGTSIGIGISTPNNKLEVVGTIMSSLEASHTISWVASSIFLDQPNSAASRIAFIGANTSTYGELDFVQASSNGSLYRSAIKINSSGNVGIGTTSPEQKLHVVGNGLVEGVILYRNGATNILNIGGDQNMYGGTNSDGGVFVYGNNKLHLSTNSARRLTVDGSGNVGIGTTSPAGKLSVNGDLFLTTTGRAIVFNSDANYATQMYESSGNLAFQTGSSERMRITSSGRVFINTTTGVGQEQFSLRFNSNESTVNQAINITDSNSSANNALYIVFRRSDEAGIGNIQRIGTTSAVAYNTTSDYRLKEDFKQIKGLDLVSKIKVYDFKWKDNDARMDGVIAHELQEVVPYAVTGKKDDKEFQSVDYSKLVPILVQAIQEQQKQIEELKTLINK
jgi:hypothetical protein